MSNRHLSALIVLVLLGGCATSPEPTFNHTSVRHAMPAMAGSVSSAPEPVSPTTPATPMQPASIVPTPAIAPKVTVAKSKPRAKKPEPRPRAETRTVSAVPAKRKSAAPRHHAPSSTHKSKASSAAEIQGRVVLAAATGQTVSKADMANTLVYFVPRSMKTHPQPGHYTIYTDHHQFDPGAMAVPAGSTVSFVNLDSVDHNVFSVTPGNQFNLGYQSHGQTTSHTFNHPGLVLISCNVHPSMEVDLLVEPSPYVTRVDTDGRFILRGVPNGPGTLYAWNPRSGIANQTLSLPQTAAVQIHLTLTRQHIETVLNVEQQP